MKQIEYNGTIKGGKLKIANRNRFETEISFVPDCDVEITIKKKSRTRSIPINRYYWGCVVEPIRERLVELGHEVSKEDTHEFLKQRYNYRELVDEKTGEVIKIGNSTADMTNTQFMEYMEHVKRFAAEVLDIQIKEPNEQGELIH